MDFLATPDTITGTAGTNTPGTPTRIGLLTDGTSPNDASLNWAKYYNMLLEEVRQVIVAFGGTPDDENWHQMATQIAATFATKIELAVVQDDLDDLRVEFNDFLNTFQNGNYGVGTHTIKVYPGITKTFTLWGAGAGGSGSGTGGVSPSAATDGGDTSITELSVVAGGGNAGTGGTWSNGSAYTDGTAGTGGVASGANTNLNGNNGVASVSDQSGGGAAGASGHGAGGQGSVGLGDNGYSYGGGGGGGAKAVHTYTNTTSSVVTLTLVVGSKGLASAHGSGMTDGEDGFATVESGV